MAKRCIMRVEVSPGVPESLDQATARFGSTHVSVVSRLMEWFVEQPDLVQAAILRLYPLNIKKELPRMVIEEMRVKNHPPRSQAQGLDNPPPAPPRGKP
jgi:hypothetical protein